MTLATRKIFCLWACAVPLLALLAWGLQSLAWMRWLPGPAIFFTALALTLLVLTSLEIRRPARERGGFLLITTTPGDRFFIGLLLSGLAHMLYLGLVDPETAVWPMSLACLVWMAGVLRWG